MEDVLFFVFLFFICFVFVFICFIVTLYLFIFYRLNILTLNTLKQINFHAFFTGF